MKRIVDSYLLKPDRNTLSILHSLTTLEEFVSETRDHLSQWLLGIEASEGVKLFHLLKKRTRYEEYDKFVSQDGGAHFGEGWNGSFRIYDMEVTTHIIIIYT
eukprot:TRINITY_DN2622_c0_g1_i3.p1 TRINITY_DN2622_c0_g1~~TRINITY_DN2622_c0_g1_i3.p1  ORF type:complete len:102 (-),score=0.56 TRINITY_DN2622_c0_g1_i3:106-411(-)